MTDALRRLGTLAPLVLLLEDLHWADPATLLLMTHLVPRVAATPTVIVATFRPDEGGTQDPFGRALEQWRRTGVVEQLVLRGLDHREVGEMLTALAGSAPPERVVTRWHELTGGNPFFVTEVFHHLSAEALVLAPDGSWRELADDADLPVPPAVRRVTEVRVRSLPPPTREVLEALAVAEHATAEVLSETLLTASDVVVEAVDDAHRLALLDSATSSAGSGYRFAHELIRLAVLAGVGPQRRRRLHASVARALETTDPERLDVRAAELVHHLCRAGTVVEPERLLTHLDAAAAHAERAAAFEDALVHLDTALGLVGAHRGDRWVQFVERRARALCGLGRWDEAAAAWQDAVHHLGRAHETSAIGALCVEAAGNLFWSGRYDQAMTAVHTGLAALGDQASADRTRLLATGGKCATFAGDHRTGEELTAEALLVAEEVGDRAASAAAGFARTVHHWSVVEPTLAVTHARRAAADARADGALWELADGLGFAQFAHVLAGETGAVAAIGTEIDGLVERLGHYGAAFMRGRARVLHEITGGDLDVVASSARADLDRCRSLGLPWTADSHAWLGLTAFWRGDWSEADELYEQGIAGDPSGILSGACWAMAFLLRAHQGDDRACHRMLRDAPDRLPTLGGTAGLGSWTSLLAVTEGLVLLGHRQDAAHHYPAVLQALAAGNVLRGYDNRLIEGVAGLAAGASGDHARADEHFRRALRQAEAIPHRLEQPEVRRLYAWTLLERGDVGARALAAELLDEAVAGYRAIGMPRHEELARGLRAAAGTDAAGGLTARERGVLLELAAGRTSKEIARRWSISVPTVNRHIANLYAKIDARNRTEATRWAMGHGLVTTRVEGAP
ncbi:MAG: hypothetical protein QOE59_1804 [Actinomycetota bacterium]|nr:hypothetical protein [Actinomycetota bacterium]